jgi:outer membrane protein assembly factor BamD (BamD/ComL family)
MKRLGITLCVLMILSSVCRAGVVPFVGASLSEGELFHRARDQVKRGELDFAYLDFRQLLDQYPSSPYAERVLFAVGEYHFIKRNFRDASDCFLSLVDRYPDSASVIFALSYLLKIAEDRQDRQAVEQLSRTIATFYRLSLVFRNSKQYTYRSALLRRHRVVYYIDKVDFFIDGEPFAQIAY